MQGSNFDNSRGVLDAASIPGLNDELRRIAVLAAEGFDSYLTLLVQLKRRLTLFVAEQFPDSIIPVDVSDLIVYPLAELHDAFDRVYRFADITPEVSDLIRMAGDELSAQIMATLRDHRN